MPAPIITLLTDFGLEDTYVASMKGVILGVCPEARLIDITHLAPPQDIRAGAFLLASVCRDFPSGTVHLAVIDPGVGTDRRGLVLEADHYLFVGPDNGLFSWVVQEASAWKAYSIENTAHWRPTVSRTFHGRDIFAPIAAHLAKGLPAHALGAPCAPLIASWADAAQTGDELLGEIIHIDHFGNAVTNVSGKVLARFAPKTRLSVRVGAFSVSAIVDTYGDQAPGTIVALIGSSGRLEIAVNQGNAATRCGLCRGDSVRIVRKGDGDNEC
jgi:S-adenosyl-L-methionine hydrolase (adenosine-forming)